MSRTTTAVSRRTVGGNTTGRPTDDLRASQTTGTMPTLQRAVVVEVIDNPSALTDEQKQAIAEQVNNPEFVDILPTNAIIARMVSDSQDTGNPVSTLLYPLFSTYLELPIAPGEHVQVIYPDPGRSGTVIGYWITRVSEQRTVEDVNYTAHDRRFFPQYNPQNLSTSERSQDQPTEPDFPNGAGTTQTATLRVTGSNNENPYTGIVNGSTAIRNFTFEVVPRWNKRVGEFVIQGKNNSTIILGEDRTGPVVRATADAVGQAGSIDLVAGRSRKLPESEDADPEDTAPRIIENSRHQTEVNKTPYLQEGRQDNPREGDPDFANDAARVLVTMQSEADKNFGITELTFPSDTLTPVQPNDGTPGTEGKSYVVAKADHIRVIARKDDTIDGTVLIVREGTDADNIAFLYIDADGKLQVHAPEIYFGKATGKGEPYIKWTEYKKSVEKLQAQIDELKTFCDNLSTALTTAFAAPIAIPYSPVSTLVSAVPQIVRAKATLQANLIQPKQATSQAVTDAKSTRIFGE